MAAKKQTTAKKTSLKTMVTIPEELAPLWKNLLNKSIFIRMALLELASNSEKRKYFFKNIKEVENVVESFNEDSNNDENKATASFVEEKKPVKRTTKLGYSLD